MRATFWPVLWLPAVHAVAAGMGVRSIARVAPARMSVAISDDNVEQRKNPALYSATAAVRTDGPASSPPRMRRPAGKPEVLAPAGGWAQARAAVANGADAIYFGVRESFNARARAENFAIDELPELMSFLHSHGVKGFCAVNVLIFDEELREAESLIRALAASGVDALIVQDPAVLLLARRVAEWLPLHASTQMSITSAEGAEFAAHSFGCSRVVVGRELSVREIARVAERTDAEVEVRPLQKTRPPQAVGEWRGDPPYNTTDPPDTTSPLPYDSLPSAPLAPAHHLRPSHSRTQAMHGKRIRAPATHAEPLSPPPLPRRLSTAPCASPTPGSASPLRAGAAGPPTAASARRPAGSRMVCLSTAPWRSWATCSICSRRKT